MRILVVGASGATGRRVVKLLLERGHHVVAVVRQGARLPLERSHPRLTVEYADLLALSGPQLIGCVQSCDAVVSCLGHTPSLRGVFGQPRRLVTTATTRLCEAIRRSGSRRHIRFILMNSAGTLDTGARETHSFMERCLAGALRLLLPPYRDNVMAAACLRNDASKTGARVQWAMVRPDNLTDAETAGGYTVHASPVRSAFFGPGRVSRANVADFICTLVCDTQTWRQWQGKMPVVYDR